MIRLEKQKLELIELHRPVALVPPHPSVTPMNLSEKLMQAELLPGWYDDSVVSEQRRLLQATVTLLERLADSYLRDGEPVWTMRQPSCVMSQ